MSFKKPFRAVPVKEGQAHKKRRKRAENRTFNLRLLKWSLVAIVVGSLVGYMTSRRDDGEMRAVDLFASASNATTGLQAGQDKDLYFEYCEQARAAGRAPIYIGQSGYRSELDADGDGVACERYHGR